MRFSLLHITVLCFFVAISANAQISPGDLSNAHADMEGIMNCTKCHVLGGEVSNEKCLDCHLELKTRIDQKKGYHVSDEVKNKDCTTCHSDHHGRNFEMVRFNEDDFRHQLTGYELTGQ
ncbi:MAG: cytochrome c family protein, partial [Cyclobacteriaceae bacterium]|nr:cytochrome c family protein [Cyclobacteriaceae bacterium]